MCTPTMWSPHTQTEYCQKTTLYNFRRTLYNASIVPSSSPGALADLCRALRGLTWFPSSWRCGRVECPCCGMDVMAELRRGCEEAMAVAMRGVCIGCFDLLEGERCELGRRCVGGNGRGDDGAEIT